MVFDQFIAGWDSGRGEGPDSGNMAGAEGWSYKGSLKVAMSIGVMSTLETEGAVLMIEWMNVVIAGPVRTGRDEAVMRAIFLSAEAIFEDVVWGCCLRGKLEVEE